MKFANIEKLSSGDIFALLDSIESDAERDVETIMNDSDTELVAEDELVISTNIIRKKKRSVTKVAWCQFQKHQSKFCLPKTRMKPII